MIQYDETRLAMEALTPQIEELRGALNLDGIQIKVDELEMKSTEPNFWDDPEKAQAVQQQIGQYKNTIENFNRLKTNHDDVLAMIELAEEENDESAVDEVKELAEKVKTEFEEQKLATLMTGEYDSSNAILTFHAGAGGTEAQDWCQMLYRMITRWAETNKFKVKLLDWLDGDAAGLKSATITVEGPHAYGFLKSENGVHRLVRVSPFDAQGRRQTSFASIEVMPEFPDLDEIQLRDEDYEFVPFHSSGAGGQNINKVSSAVRITHKATGIVVTCQTERSQLQNKETALRMLKAKLMDIKIRERLDTIEQIQGNKNNIEWGSQIRSYVFMPYTLVKDTRTGYEEVDVEAVMNGRLDGFINAYLKYITMDKAK